ncbi:surfeit locus 1 family protein [Altererythrobacter atlanticus]|uniref:SURF1-like protein n=1 Tax=Croceibacterium atlanticum TaxID=1267766 RepID=A0A0F7KT31_9SPHN|nr:SURF1 family protein [Croceibacterium atlanticum]AKH42321.1 SURF1 family protein [Croceibacterium atlanticum]MBB5731098.1 surfeit locus 1 family protein [Croceibacterium atlanticum]
MTRKLPIFATLVVGAAVATMIALGIWQMNRAGWKADLLSRYETALEDSDPVAWPRDPAGYEAALYRRSSVNCTQVTARDAIAGRSESGETGWAQTATCILPDGERAVVALGWARDVETRDWEGGTVQGYVSPAGEGVRLVAAPAQAGLEQLARPDPNDLPNNHLSYAVQWFFFAATAVVIYLLALRRRRKDG